MSGVGVGVGGGGGNPVWVFPSFLLTPYSSSFFRQSEFKGNLKRGNMVDDRANE